MGLEPKNIGKRDTTGIPISVHHFLKDEASEKMWIKYKPIPSVKTTQMIPIRTTILLTVASFI